MTDAAAAWRRAVAVWAQFPNREDVPYETASRPMHPGLYFALARARHFAAMNGDGYDAYVACWRARYGAAAARE